jgi:large conductance mechanosensitive channel
MFKRAITFFKHNVGEFREFAFKGNLIQLAIGVVLGGAFGDLIKSFVSNVFMPVISIFSANPVKGAGYTQWQWRGVKFGAFLGDMISFVVIALAIFVLMVKVIGWMIQLTARVRGPAAPSEPIDKECPLCLMKIPMKAVKCGHCTSDLPPGTMPMAPI